MLFYANALCRLRVGELRWETERATKTSNGRAMARQLHCAFKSRQAMNSQSGKPTGAALSIYADDFRKYRQAICQL